jgi:hypothetical protein
MSDISVAAALRSQARLVVIEAPAGCGKTFQGAEYARELAENINGRVLILTHTHAACDVFASRTRGVGGRVDVRTIDSLIGQIATVYHQSLGLPIDTATWARSRKNGYSELAAKVARLLRASPIVAQALAQRYPIIICDEHQDASADQHSVAIACHDAGSQVRIFGDPMQRIFGSKPSEIAADNLRWESLKKEAQAFEELDKPHRWKESRELGQWILEARLSLRSGGQINLRSHLPTGLTVIVADNQSPSRERYILANGSGKKAIYKLPLTTNSLLVLAAQNTTVEALRAFFGRRLPIWEGHLRENLAEMILVIREHDGNAENITQAVINFMNKVATGFSPSDFGKTLLDEVCAGCVAKRKGKPATLQRLGQMILDQPNHLGVAKMLGKLGELIKTDIAFKDVNIDYYREFWDAVRLGQFSDADEGFAEISRRRTYSRSLIPDKAISTIHKAKGLECSDVLIIPCDRAHFSDTQAARYKLYVAISRAKRSLTIVVSSSNPSPLLAT